MDSTEKAPPDRAEFSSERGARDLAEQESAKSYDQAMLTLAAGALGLSVAFVKDIAPEPVSWSLPALFAGWGCLAYSVLSVVRSFEVAQKHIRWLTRWADIKYNPGYPKPPPEIPDAKTATGLGLNPDQPWGDYVDTLNRRAFWYFRAGVVAILIFSGINVTWRSLYGRREGNAPVAAGPGYGIQGLPQVGPAAPSTPSAPASR